MEKGGPFINVVCRTRYIGRDCRSIGHGVAFEGRTVNRLDCGSRLLSVSPHTHTHTHTSVRQHTSISL